MDHSPIRVTPINPDGPAETTLAPAGDPCRDMPARLVRRGIIMVNIPGFDPDLGVSFCRAGIPFFDTAERALTTYAQVFAYQRWRKASAG
jgi:acyl-CoA synthetase (NDP forming)